MVSKSKLFSRIAYNIILFVRHMIGVVQTPYETYRRLAKGEHLLQILPLLLVCIGYFGWSSLVHHGITAHPYLLTFSFGKLVAGFIVTYMLVVVSLVGVGRAIGGVGGIRTIVLPWTYSLVPTIVWFFGTSVMTLLFPPPRTVSILGQAFSFLFLSFSLFLFFWKAILYYLTLRLGMKLSMGKIFIASLILFPLGALYAVALYQMGIFRIPFI